MEKLLHIVLLIALTFIENSFGFFSRPFNAEKDTLIFLRTRARSFSESEIIKFDDKEELANTIFDPSKPTVFHVHGFLESQKVEHHINLSQ